MVSALYRVVLEGMNKIMVPTWQARRNEATAISQATNEFHLRACLSIQKVTLGTNKHNHLYTTAL